MGQVEMNAIEKELGLDFDFMNEAYREEYYEAIQDLINHDVVKALGKFLQHGCSNRLEHSLFVSYYSFEFAKMAGLDYRSCARAGLLHDLFHYDWRVRDDAPKENHIVAHPIVALRTAVAHFDLNDIEKDAILKHMWPLALGRPLYKESTVVSMVDKYVASIEMGMTFKRFAQEKILAMKVILAKEII